jgi:hypothetical protein
MLFGKLVSMLAQAKGAAVATLFIASGVTTTVAVSNSPEAQQTITNVTESVSTTLAAVMNVNGKPCVGNPDRGQPEVVAQRNAADKLLRDAWQEDQKKVLALRQSTDADNKDVNDLVKTYQGKLKDRLDEALTDVAKLTLGREGAVNKAPTDGSGSASPADGSGSAAPADGSGSAGNKKPACTPKPSPTGAPAPTDGSAAAAPSDGSDSGKQQGRVAVANRTTLNADLKTLVEEAVKDMDDLVKEATEKASELEPSDSERGKPEDKEKGKPSDKPSNPNKPSNSPRG